MNTRPTPSSMAAREHSSPPHPHAHPPGEKKGPAVGWCGRTAGATPLRPPAALRPQGTRAVQARPPRRRLAVAGGRSGAAPAVLPHQATGRPWIHFFFLGEGGGVAGSFGNRGAFRQSHEEGTARCDCRAGFPREALMKADKPAAALACKLSAIGRQVTVS